MHTHGVICVWSYLLASTAASPILRAQQVVAEAEHAARLVGEIVAMGWSRGLLPNFVLPEAKEELVHLQEVEGAVAISMGRGERGEERQIESCQNPKRSILRHETWEHYRPEANAELAVRRE